jgi:hypothetical protein
VSAGGPGPAERPGEDDDLGFEIPDDLSGLDELSGADAPAPSAPDVEVPDDLSGLEAAGAEPDEPVVAILVTQVAGARPLAAACSLAGVDVDAVASPVGALAVLRDTADATRTAEAAAAVSGMLRTSPVVLLDRRAGRIAASRWVAGEREDDLPAGLVLSGAPAVLEDLLVGGAPVADVPGVETSVGMSRWAAMRALASGRRKGE